MVQPIQNSNIQPAGQSNDFFKTIVVAGATGHLGQRIAFHLKAADVRVVALVRKNSDHRKIAILKNQGLILVEVDYNDSDKLIEVCKGAHCIVSALSGLEDVIIGVQSQLLQAALYSGVTRFIPSDYCIDYTKLEYGTNRNLDLRRRFNEQLDKTAVRGTSILNGMFTDLLTGQAPVVLSGLKRVLYWGDADQLLDFTTMENTAEYTARACVDDNTPRYLRIAGDVINAKGLKDSATQATGKNFRLLRAGGLKRLQTLIGITRKLFPQKKEVFPAWQGMQYMHNMFTGKPKLTPLDNDRYSGIRWTLVKEVLSNYNI